MSLSILRNLHLVVLALVLALGLTACGPAGEDAEAPADAPSAAESDAEEAAEEDADGEGEPEYEEATMGEDADADREDAPAEGADADEEAMAGQDARDCSALLGAWRSAPYRAMSVRGDGSTESIEGLAMRLVIEDATDCRLTGFHEWDNGEIGGSERLIGVADPDTGEARFLEVGPHPEGGTNGQMWGWLEEDGQMRLGYMGLQADNGVGNAFATRLAREDAEREPEPLVCVERTGSWTHEGFRFARIPLDGEWFLQPTDFGAIEVEEHADCGFSGTMGWRFEDAEAEELIVGVMTGEDFGFLHEVGVHPIGGGEGSIGLKTLRHVGDLMDVYQAAISVDGQEGHASAKRYHLAGEPQELLSCPDLLGSWTSGPFTVTRLHDDGRRESFVHPAREVVIDAQDGCLFKGTNRWQDGDEVWHEEPYTGVMDPDDGLLYLAEFPPHPGPGSTALIQERLVGEDTLVTLYVGSAEANRYGDALNTILTRE